MDLRVASVLLVLLALAEATPDRYYRVPKVAKTPYPVKSHGESHEYFLTRVVHVRRFDYNNSYDNLLRGGYAAVNTNTGGSNPSGESKQE